VTVPTFLRADSPVPRARAKKNLGKKTYGLFVSIFTDTSFCEQGGGRFYSRVERLRGVSARGQ
jgi:hypothetical protein